MVLQLPWMDLLWIVALLDCSLTTFATTNYVKCNLGKETEGSCSCWEIQVTETPWPPNDAPVAPEPRNASLEMDNYDGYLFPEIGWILDRQHANDVDGFYMEVWLIPNYYKFYRCTHNVSTILKNCPEDSIAYKFEGCCRSLYSGFEIGDELDVKIFSLPMYGVNDEPKFALASLIVEGDEVQGHDLDYYDDGWEYVKELKNIHKKLKSITEENLSRLSIHNPKNILLESPAQQNLRKKDD